MAKGAEAVKHSAQASLETFPDRQEIMQLEAVRPGTSVWLRTRPFERAGGRAWLAPPATGARATDVKSRFLDDLPWRT